MGRKKNDDNDDNDGYFVCVHLDEYYFLIENYQK